MAQHNPFRSLKLTTPRTAHSLLSTELVAVSAYTALAAVTRGGHQQRYPGDTRGSRVSKNLSAVLVSCSVECDAARAKLVGVLFATSRVHTRTAREQRAGERSCTRELLLRLALPSVETLVAWWFFVNATDETTEASAARLLAAAAVCALMEGHQYPQQYYGGGMADAGTTTAELTAVAEELAKNSAKVCAATKYDYLAVLVSSVARTLP